MEVVSGAVSDDLVHASHTYAVDVDYRHVVDIAQDEADQGDGDQMATCWQSWNSSDIFVVCLHV